MDGTTLTALTKNGTWTRGYLLVHGRDENGDPVEIGFYSGQSNVSVSVVSGLDGSVESRDYFGDSSLISWDTIPQVIGLEARSVQFKLSQLHAAVQDMIRAYNIRLSSVEFHRGVYDPNTEALVSTPFPQFVGRVDTAKLQTPAVGAQGSLSLRAVSDTIEMTQTNHQLASHANQILRSNDQFRVYSDTAGTIQTVWGEAKRT